MLGFACVAYEMLTEECFDHESINVVKTWSDPPNEKSGKSRLRQFIWYILDSFETLKFADLRAHSFMQQPKSWEEV
jgi:hypothetical protein